MTDISRRSSYTQILKASSIMGGAAGIKLLLGMVGIKFAAVLIGATGIGLIASFAAAQGVVGTIAGLGIQSSAVREVAAAVGKNDEQAIGRIALSLRRVCWLTGLVGMGGMMAFSPLISQLSFGSQQYTEDIAALSIVILMGNISGGQMALLQGMSRVGDLARANIFGAVFATIAAVCFYAWLGLRGIVPAVIATSVMYLLLSCFFARRVSIPKVTLGWRETIDEVGGMVQLGLAVMLSGLLSSVLSYITVILITQQVGLGAVGIYSAAFALSGAFVNFVLSAMGADYYPRLTALTHDHTAMSQLVNEQTEVGVLLAVPGLMATMALAPWAVQIFYTSEFFPAVELLQWFVLGCLGRVISWPLGYVMLASGKSRLFLTTEAAFIVIHGVLIALGLFVFGIVGVAIAFFVTYVAYTIAARIVCHQLIEFRWSSQSSQMCLYALLVLGLNLLIVSVMAPLPATMLSSLLTLTVLLYCFRALVRRVGIENRIIRIACKVPCIRILCGL